MNLGQTIITLGAFVLMSTVILGMNTSFVENGKSIDEAGDGIMGLSLATSFIELAQALPFDEKTIGAYVQFTSYLTQADKLGPEPDTLAPEVDVQSFDDFDDFNGWEELVIIGGKPGVPDTAAGGTHYQLFFNVYYVDPTDLNTPSTSQSFLKRLDVKVWRAHPAGRDTLTASHVMGYWHFD